MTASINRESPVRLYVEVAWDGMEFVTGPSSHNTSLYEPNHVIATHCCDGASDICSESYAVQIYALNVDIAMQSMTP
jgi:hypothetical protein